MLTACSGKSLALPEVLGGKRETVTFSDSLYRPDQEFEKISCDVREGCYAVDSEMEAGLLIGNLVRSGQREAAIVADEDLDLDKIFIYALALSPSTFEAQYTQRRMMNGTRRTIFTVTMEDEQQLQRNRVQARRIVEENVSAEMDQTETIRVLHDWLVLHTQYDEEAVALNEEERRQSLAFRASGVFERGRRPVQVIWKRWICFWRPPGSAPSVFSAIRWIMPGIWSVWMGKCVTSTRRLTIRCRISPAG